MSGNSFGKLFKITSCGESHGPAIGVIIEGCPPGFSITSDDIQLELNRRKPGQSHITTPRLENDCVQILSGVTQGRTTGAPILIVVDNQDIKSEDYDEMRKLFRPSHADFTYHKKYGLTDLRGGGRSSARETIARVAAGAIAKKYLKEHLQIEIISYVEQVGSIQTFMNYQEATLEKIESNAIRCPDELVASEMINYISTIKEEGDSVGGIIRGVIKNLPIGLGEPVFDKLPADLAKAMLSINASKGFEIGSGFHGVKLKGSEHNDPFTIENNQVKIKTNHAGGTLGGISTGEDIYFRVAFKPVSTIKKPQTTVNFKNESVQLEAKGRHDPCVLPRAVPIVDAMSALVIMDHYLRNKTIS